MTENSDFHSTLLQDEQDWQQLLQSVEQIHSSDPFHCIWHMGDLMWTRYRNQAIDPRKHIRLWKNAAGELLAFAWFLSYGTTIQVAPDARQQKVLYEDILNWAEEYWLTTFADQPQRRNLWCYAFDDDSFLQEALFQHGFQRGEDCQLLFFQELSTELARSELPIGWTIRPLRNTQEYTRRIEIEFAAWGIGQSFEDYQRMRAVPEYLPELDLGVFDTEDTMLAYTTIWLDGQGSCGYFEPVTVHPTAQRQGIGRMLLQEGLYQLKNQGARYARVCPPDDNEGAKKLYASVGFVRHNQTWIWGKQLRRVEESIGN
ncbi:GNAT family N-acetyltransferase [Tengunoibacter tsumagoiensis]|uniref:N-acetyltransferase domain-containing protein n=1 Tax=Tengunoibacter tsumagoiensis TaxID=2014871 RepID=A0A402A9K1_9CHLR|nr:GNAT family N-acetyltransferase [Tengunoibacter tsumagoiensis]GCE15635.1 hypothetical protein KTT_54940 [Tengunoibacter tsumagoiensis]